MTRAGGAKVEGAPGSETLIKSTRSVCGAGAVYYVLIGGSTGIMWGHVWILWRCHKSASVTIQSSVGLVSNRVVVCSVQGHTFN